MKKWMIILSISCFVYLTYFQLNQEVTFGQGTFDCPYQTRNTAIIKEIEEIFENHFDDLVEKSDMEYKEYTDIVWENDENPSDSIIYIDSMRYLGWYHYLYYIMFGYDGRVIDPTMKYDAPNRIHDDQIMFTSSYYSLDYSWEERFELEYEHKRDSKEGGDAFSKTINSRRGSNQESSGLMIVNYKVNIDQQWYFASTLIDDDKVSFLTFPKRNGHLTIHAYDASLEEYYLQ